MNILHGICLAMLGLIAASGMVTAGGGPMADAGLDQSVPVDTTVQLDATGSTHPEGDIESYEWRIETPGGQEIAPDCTACARTTFRPNTTGQYEVTVTVTGSSGATASDTLYIDVEGAPAGPSPDAPETGRESTGDTTAEPIETEYTVQNPVSGCINDVSGEAVTRYVRASDVENCDTGGEWVQPEMKQSQTEMTVEIRNYERDEGIFSEGLLPEYEEPRYPATRGSEGMGRHGESVPLIGEAREKQQSETGTLEGILYGADSAEVTTYETSGEDARELIRQDSWESAYWQKGQTSRPVSSRYNDIEQTDGASAEELKDNKRVEVTITAGEGEGVLDRLSLSEIYSRENYESDRSSISDLTSSVSSGISNSIPSTDRFLGDSNNEPEDSTDEQTKTDETGDTTLDLDEPSSENSELSDPVYDTSSTQEDSEEQDIGSPDSFSDYGMNPRNIPGMKSNTESAISGI